MNDVILRGEDLDLDAYLKPPKEAKHVRPAEDYRQAVMDRMFKDGESNWCVMPWIKTHDKIVFCPGDTTIWAGINGHGKSNFLSQVTLGLVAQSQKVCIASFEMKPARTLQIMSTQFCGYHDPSPKLVDTMMDFFKGRLWIYDQSTTVKPHIITAVIKWCVERLGIQHFVLDSFMKCGINQDDYNRQKEFMDELTTFIKQSDSHLHVVCHIRKKESERHMVDKFDVRGAGEITDMADNVITIFRNKRKEREKEKDEPNLDILDSPDTIVSCDKQRNGREWEGTTGFWFDKQTHQFLSAPSSRKFTHEDWMEARWQR